MESSFPEGAWEVARLSAMRWDGIQQATQGCKNRHSNTTVMSTIESWWIIITSKRNRRAAPQLMEITAARVQKLGWCAPVKPWDFRAGTVWLVKWKCRWSAVFSIAQYLEGSKYQNKMLLLQILPYQWGWREERSLKESPLLIIIELLYPCHAQKSMFLNSLHPSFSMQHQG